MLNKAPQCVKQAATNIHNGHSCIQIIYTHICTYIFLHFHRLFANFGRRQVQCATKCAKQVLQGRYQICGINYKLTVVLQGSEQLVSSSGMWRLKCREVLMKLPSLNFQEVYRYIVGVQLQIPLVLTFHFSFSCDSLLFTKFLQFF